MFLRNRITEKILIFDLQLADLLDFCDLLGDLRDFHDLLWVKNQGKMGEEAGVESGLIQEGSVRKRSLAATDCKERASVAGS